MAKTTGGHCTEDHFADVSKMVETKQRKRLGKAETPAKKKSDDKQRKRSHENVNCRLFRCELTIY